MVKKLRMTLLKFCEQRLVLGPDFPPQKTVPGAGLEPAWAFEVPQDFKSCASANFATRARQIYLYDASQQLENTQACASVPTFNQILIGGLGLC